MLFKAEPGPALVGVASPVPLVHAYLEAFYGRGLGFQHLEGVEVDAGLPGYCVELLLVAGVDDEAAGGQLGVAGEEGLRDASDGHSLAEEEVHRLVGVVEAGVEKVAHLAGFVYDADGLLVVVDLLQLDVGDPLDGVDRDAHELGQRVGGCVVGPVGRAVWLPCEAVVGEPCPAEEGLYEAHLGLGERDHVAALAVDVAVRGERLLGPIEIDVLY